MSYFWLGFMVLAFVVEAATVGLVAIWFGLGALAAFLSAVCGGPVWLQITFFILITAVTLIFTRPLAQKYLKGCSGVISFVLKGGKEAAVQFMNSLKLASNEVHVADIRTCVLHPASETHRQLTDEQLKAAGIDGGMVRFSVGLENVQDILEDIEQALNTI